MEQEKERFQVAMTSPEELQALLNEGAKHGYEVQSTHALADGRVMVVFEDEAPRAWVPAEAVQRKRSEQVPFGVTTE